MRTGRLEPVALDSVAARPCSILRQVLLGLEVLQRIEEGKDGVVHFDLKRKSGGPDSSRSTEGGRWLRRALLLLLAVVVVSASNILLKDGRVALCDFGSAARVSQRTEARTTEQHPRIGEGTRE